MIRFGSLRIALLAQCKMILTQDTTLDSQISYLANPDAVNSEQVYVYNHLRNAQK